MEKSCSIKILLAALVIARCQIESLYNRHFQLSLGTNFEFLMKVAHRAAKYQDIVHSNIKLTGEHNLKIQTILE